MSGEEPKSDSGEKVTRDDQIVKTTPIKIASSILIACGLLDCFLGAGFVFVRVRYQAFVPIIGYNIWCGLVIASAGCVGIAALKTMNRKVQIAAGAMGLAAELMSSSLCYNAIKILFDMVGRTAEFLALPEAEAKAGNTAGQGTTLASAEPETFGPIIAHQMRVFLILNCILACLFITSLCCGSSLAWYTLRPFCKKKVKPDEQPEKQSV